MLNDQEISSEGRDPRLLALEWLRDVFHYPTIDGKSVDFAAERDDEGQTEPLLTGRLVAALQRINPGLSETGARHAAARLKQPVAAGLLDANASCHRLLSRWITIDEFGPTTGKLAGRSVRFIDFEDPENNDFLVVEDFPVKGPQGIGQLDLVIFVNGIPVVAVECGNPDGPNGIEYAMRELLRKQESDAGIARFFHTIHFCIALGVTEARFGTSGTPPERYAEWKSCYPETKAALGHTTGRKLTKQDQLLAGLCAKANLLDMIRNFTAFDREGGRLVKKIARYQQFEAVNRALTRATGSRPRRGRGGIVWHTQGSGKSLTMLWLCLKLRREKKLGNPTLLVVTDRRDLDHQITETFRNCGFENPVRAEKVSHLKKLLRGPSGQTILTTIQKFQDDVTRSAGKHSGKKEPLARGGNLFVLIDEAHRTEYGLFNARLRKALPDACLIAFTGTPIPKTERKFGSYIHRYTMAQSVADGATVPILYENRLPELAVWGGPVDPRFEVEFSRLTRKQRDQLKQQEITGRKIAEAPDRITMIADDLVEHYRSNFEPDGFKAQVAACSQRAAAMYWENLDRLMPGRVALLISDPSEKDPHLRVIRERFADEESIINDFKNGPVEKLAIIVVMNKYLTGFDVPNERVLYLDKPMKEHTLLQGIARVNRPHPEKDKQWGLVVDYWGVARFLDKALRNLQEDIRPETVMRLRADEKSFKVLKKRHADVLACFPSNLDRTCIEPWVLVLESEDRRAVFEARYRLFCQSLDRLLPDPKALNLIEDFAWLRKIRREAVNWYRPGEDQRPDCSEKVRQLIDCHVKNRRVKVLLKPVRVFSPEFCRQVESLHSARAKAIRMRHALRQTISVKLHEDPVFYESLHDRLERIIRESDNQRFDEAAEFEFLSVLAEDLEKKRAAEEPANLPAEVAPFFRSIRQATEAEGTARVRDSGADETKLVQLAAKVFEALRDAAVIDWIHKEDAQREMRRRIKGQLRMNYQIPSGNVETLTASLMDLARVHLAN